MSPFNSQNNIIGDLHWPNNKKQISKIKTLHLKIKQIYFQYSYFDFLNLFILYIIPVLMVTNKA